MKCKSDLAKENLWNKKNFFALKKAELPQPIYTCVYHTVLRFRIACLAYYKQGKLFENPLQRGKACFNSKCKLIFQLIFKEKLRKYLCSWNDAKIGFTTPPSFNIGFCLVSFFHRLSQSDFLSSQNTVLQSCYRLKRCSAIFWDRW